MDQTHIHKHTYTETHTHNGLIAILRCLGLKVSCLFSATDCPSQKLPLTTGEYSPDTHVETTGGRRSSRNSEISALPTPW